MDTETDRTVEEEYILALKGSNKDVELILEADDEKKLLRIIEQDAYSSWEDLKKKCNLK